MMGRFSYQKDFRLKSRSDFLRSKSSKQRLYIQNCIVSYLKNSYGHARLGCTVTKARGKAFQRNLFKRRVKEAFRAHEGLRALPFDIHVIPQIKVEEYSWSRIVEVLDGAFNAFLTLDQQTQ